MMTFPLGGNGYLAVIEPGNLERLKQGKPMKVGPDVMIAYVPDMAYFAQLLGLPSELPPRGEQVRASAIHITAEQLDAALKASKDRPEIVR